MERQFGLPIAFAAAAHAALLFAFDRPPTRVTATAPKTIVREFVIERVADEPPPLTAPDTGQREMAPPPPPVPNPRSVEPPPIDPGTQPTINPPPIPPARVGDTLAIDPSPLFPAGPRGDTWGPGDVISRQLLDHAPRTRFQPAPIYPFESKRDGIKGEVHVEFIVDESGLVRDPRVITSSHRMFDEPTLRAVAKWRFEPGRRHGRVVAFKMAVPVVFSLND